MRSSSIKYESGGSLIIDQQIQELLRKEMVKVSEPSSDQFLSSIFLIPKKNGGHRSIVNLKKFNQYISCVHLKMEVLFLLKEHLQRGNCWCTIDHKDTYFSVLLHEDSQNFLKFKWKGSIYQFLCRVYFVFGPATRIFTKTMKIPISLLWKLNLHPYNFCTIF